MPLLSLPTEILHIIFECNVGNIEALKSCSLVCKALNQTVRRHLFRRLGGTVHDIPENTSKTAFSRTICNYVRETTCFDMGSAEHTFKTLTTFRNLRSLDCVGVPGVLDLPEIVQDNAFFPCVEHLTLADWLTYDLEMMHWLLASTPSLKLISFIRSTFILRRMPTKDDVNRYPTLAHREIAVQVHKPRHARSVSFLQHNRQPIDLPSILAWHNIRLRALRLSPIHDPSYVSNSGRNELEWAAEVQELCTGVLVEPVSYEKYINVKDTFDLQHCTQLRVVVFRSIRLDKDNKTMANFILDQLKSISSKKLETVSLEISRSDSTLRQWEDRKDLRLDLKPISDYVLENGLMLLVYFRALPGPYDGPSAGTGRRSSIAETGSALTQALFPELFAIGRASYTRFSTIAQERQDVHKHILRLYDW